MELRRGSHLLLPFVLLGILCSLAVALPPLEAYPDMRNARHADGLFTSEYSKLLGQLSAKKYLESLVGKRVGDNSPLDEQMPVKRHSDSVFTDTYSRLRKQMAVKKYLDSVLAGKRSEEDDFEPAYLEDGTSIDVLDVLSNLSPHI